MEVEVEVGVGSDHAVRDGVGIGPPSHPIPNIHRRTLYPTPTVALADCFEDRREVSELGRVDVLVSTIFVQELCAFEMSVVDRSQPRAKVRGKA